MNIELDRDWNLWPDFAVRSAGFPVSGLDVFGPDEEAGLAEVARDPQFRDAVAWQSRESLANAVDKLGASGRGSPSSRRRWADVTASYWQRYCSKNDTIGFFGPLAWGSFGSETAVRMGGIRERVVHFETWAMEALADAPLPMGPFPERFLDPGTPGPDRLLAARAAIDGDVVGGLDALDRVFEEVTGRPAVRGESDSGGGRTIAYLDCMRDLDLTLGPEVLGELRSSLPPVLRASRWWCGRVFARGSELLSRMAVDGPLAPQLGRLMGAGFGLWDQLGDDQRELQRRFATGDGFEDWTPAWYGSNYHSADLQIAAESVEAIRRGEFLIVLGDFHGGGNPLAQGLFGLRHPDPPALLRRLAVEAGPGIHLSPPRHGAVQMTARAWPLYPEGDTVIVAGDEPAPAGCRRVALEDLVVQGGRVLGVPVAELLYLPIFVAALRSFDPIGESLGRAQIGKLVVRRAGGSGLRRAFARSPLERKPRFVDFESPSLVRALKRFGAPLEYAEMLPGPSECWLGDSAGRRYTSELRVVAVSPR